MDDFLTPDEISNVRQELAEAVVWAEEKVKIANQSYETIDKHIRRLDQDLKKFEEELEKERKQQEQLQEQTLKAHGKKRKRDFDPDPRPDSAKRQSTLCIPFPYFLLLTIQPP